MKRKGKIMKNLKQFNLIFLSMLLITFSTPVHSFGFTLPDTGQELCYDWDKIICDEWHMEGPNQICDSPPARLLMKIKK